jgi:hypothetical protein
LLERASGTTSLKWWALSKLLDQHGEEASIIVERYEDGTKNTYLRKRQYTR